MSSILVCGLLAALPIIPLIAYLQPQLQFKSKSLDLKFEPLIWYSWPRQN